MHYRENNISSSVGIGYLGHLMALLSSCGSKQTRILPSFSTTTRILINAAGPVTFALMHPVSSSRILSGTLSFMATGTRRGAFCTGRTEGSMSMRYSPASPSYIITEHRQNVTLCQGHCVMLHAIDCTVNIYAYRAHLLTCLL